MAIEEVTKRLRIEATTSQVEKAAADIQKVADAEANLAVESQKAERAQLSLDSAFAKLERRYVQGVRQQKEFEDVQRRVNAAVAQNPALQERADAVLAASTQRLNAWKIANDNAANSTKLSRYELINLSRQIQDVGVSLQSGQSPLTVLVQQGSQIADVFATSQGTIGGFFRQFGGWARGFIGSAAGITSAVAAFAAAGVGAALSWSSARKDIEMQLLGIGRASQTTLADIEKIGQSGSSIFGLSVSEAREFAATLAATGRVGKEQIGDLVGIGKDLARILGVDTTEAAKLLGRAMADPAKGAADLNQRLGSFSAATLRLTQNLMEQNRVTEAQYVLAEGVKRGLEGIRESASTTANAWTALGNAISNAWDATGRFLARTTGIGFQEGLQEQADRLRAEIEGLRSTRQISARGTGPSGLIAIKEDELRRADEGLRRIAERAAEVKANLESIRLSNTIDALVPWERQLDQLRNNAIATAEAVRKIQESGGAQESPLLAALGKTMDQVQLAADRAKGALETALSPAEKLTAEFDLQVRSINARTNAERTAVAGKQVELQLAGQAVSAEEKRLAVARAMYIEQARITAAYRDQMAALQDQLNIAGARSGREKLIAQEQATYNQLIREGYTMQQAGDIAATQRLVTQKQINASVADQTRAIRDQTQYMRDVSEMGQDAADAAAAYRNAIRQGADETTAAALAAAVLERNMEAAQLAAERAANAFGGIANAATQAAAKAGDLGAKLDLIGTGKTGISFQAGSGLIGMKQGAGGFGPSATGVAPLYNPSYPNPLLKLPDPLANVKSPLEINQAWMQQQRQLMQQQQQTQQQQTQQTQTLDALQEEVARRLLAGQSAADINQLIESGVISGGTASSRFQAQLDLYQRAGATSAQTIAAIQSGVIGEGVQSTELLAAIDRLINAVNANTDAIEIGLSPFYTSQGERLLGYRGYSVQNRSTSSGGVPIYDMNGNVIGTSTSGTSSSTPYIAPPYTGTVVNPYTSPSSSTSGGVPYIGPPYTGTVVNPYTYPIPSISSTGISFSVVTPPPNVLNQPYIYQPKTFAAGGVADRPTYGVFGEAGPEAVVPLRDGAIPVRLSGNFPGGEAASVAVALPGLLQSLFALLAQRLTETNKEEKPPIAINAPLVQFAGEPNRDDVRESGFQAAQSLRRLLQQAA